MKKTFQMPALRVLNMDVIATQSIGIVSGSTSAQGDKFKAPGRGDAVIVGGNPVTQFE